MFTIVQNKKAGERILSFYWVLLWVIASGGIAASLFAFSSYAADTRLYESKILSKQILFCITEQGEIKPSFFQETFDLEKECSLNLKVDNRYEYLANITLYTYEGCSEGKCTETLAIQGKSTSHEYGDKSLQVYCSSGAKGKAPKCYEIYSYILAEDKPSFIGIKIAILKLKQNVR